MEEINRLLRHLVPTVVAYVVAKGYLPPELSGPMTEIIVVALAQGVSLVASKARDENR